MNLDDEDYKVRMDKSNNTWYFKENEIELITKKPTKEELLEMPLGTKITTNKDKYNIFIKVDKDEFKNDDGDTLCDYEINEDLTIEDEYYGTKIIEVEVPTYETVYGSSKEVKEMTIAEISKALGYEVKIIKEDK